MEMKKLESFVNDVYSIVGERYSDDFKYIIGGCHCYPATEWYGGIYLAFRRVLNDDVITDKYIKEQIAVIIEQLSKWFYK